MTRAPKSAPRPGAPAPEVAAPEAPDATADAAGPAGIAPGRRKPAAEAAGAKGGAKGRAKGGAKTPPEAPAKAPAKTAAEGDAKREAKPPRKAGARTGAKGRAKGGAKPSAPPPADPGAVREGSRLEAALFQWQTGDWEPLAALAPGSVARDPDRARLALLAASGAFQTGDDAGGRAWALRARDWGCGRERIARELVGGARNGLARAAALLGEGARADALFEGAAAVSGLAPDPARIRTLREKARIGLLPEAAALFGIAVAGLRDAPHPIEARLRALEAVAGLLQAAGTPIEPPPAPRLMRLVTALLGEADPHAALARAGADPDPVARVRFWHAVSDGFRRQGNRMMAIDSLAEAEDSLPPEAASLCAATVRRYLGLGQPELALRLLVETAMAGMVPDAPGRAAILAALARGEDGAAEHGHSLLLAELDRNPPAPTPDGRRRLLVEIGTTRERVPGQGSTMKLARFCAAGGMQLITVDMDPRNSALARRGFARAGQPFEAVTAPGEDWLEGFEGTIDYAFLDAYDFDHGQHSELRQSRYETFLGGRIDEAECHRMHLRCARALVPRLAPDGLICIDDTWLDAEGAWTAKGKLAVPFLLSNGFEILRAANRAVLLRRAGTAAHRLRPETDATVDFPGFRLLIDTTDPSASAYRTRAWHEEATSAFYDHLRDDLRPGLMIDAGANFGAVSLILRTRLPGVPLISVEPNPVLHPYLEHNLAPHAEGWTLVRAVLGRTAAAAAKFHLNPHGSQDSRVIAPVPGWQPVGVPMTTLGTLLADTAPGTPVFIKIDTQGYESEIIGGAAGWLRASSDWLIRMEFAPDWISAQGSSPGGLLNWLVDHFVVAEFPARYGFHDRPGRILARDALTRAEVPEFVAHVAGLDRRGRGWVDLLVCPRESPLLAAARSGGPGRQDGEAGDQK